MKTPLILEATYLNLSGAPRHFVVRAYGVDEKGCPMIIDAYVPLVSALDAGRTRKALLGMAKVDKLQLVNADYFRVEIRVGDDIACPGCGTLVCSCEQRSGGVDLAVDEFPNSFSSPRAYVPTERDPGPPTGTPSLARSFPLPPHTEPRRTVQAMSTFSTLGRAPAVLQ